MSTRVSSPFATSPLPVTVAPDATDAQIEDLARAALDYAVACEEEFLAEPDAHAEDLTTPGHGSDYDPCMICEPYNHDRAVAEVAAHLRDLRDEAKASARPE